MPGGTTKFFAESPSPRPRRDYSVIGSSGCGKSTLLRCSSRPEPITAGTVRIGEKAVTGLDPRVAIGFQEPRSPPLAHRRRQRGARPAATKKAEGEATVTRRAWSA